ncbi:VanZ family protein [Prosthecochloris sp. GSB1]|uniref:VanZ family protein n=1 Tax=Prosthecochloris sp. GSB1 TaxID=281093 RepID=UPI00142E371D|nr:VanZ family protein [Prosthecochloris sp. GSB1]
MPARTSRNTASISGRCMREERVPERERTGKKCLRLAERTTLFLAAAAMVQEALSRTSVGEVLQVSDKLLHVAAFYVLALLADLSFPERKYLVFNVAALFLFGVSIELLQRYVGIGRHVSVMDVVANALGITLFYLTRPALKRHPRIGRFWPQQRLNGSHRSSGEDREAGRVSAAALPLPEGTRVPERFALEFSYMQRRLRHLAGEEARLKSRLRKLLAEHAPAMAKELGDERDRCSGAFLRRLGELRLYDPQLRKNREELLGELFENRGKQARLLAEIRRIGSAGKRPGGDISGKDVPGG